MELFALLGFGAVAAGIVGMHRTRHGSPARRVVQVLLGVLAVFFAALALGALGLSLLIVLQGVRGVEIGFGGIFVLVGVPLGLLFAGAAWSLGLLALGGTRRRERGADGLSHIADPPFP